MAGQNHAASMDRENPIEVSRAVGHAQYAGFWLRVLAMFADSALLFSLCFILVIVLSFVGEIGVTIGSGAFILIQILYWPIMHASERQATFGKAMVGIKVTHVEGDRISMLRSFGREMAKIVSWLPMGIGFLIAAFTGKQQALHDMIASTVVVRDGDAHIARTLVVTAVGYAVPFIAIPLFGMAFFAGVLASVMGDMQGEMKKPPSPPTAVSKPVAPNPAAPEPIAPVTSVNPPLASATSVEIPVERIDAAPLETSAQQRNGGAPKAAAPNPAAAPIALQEPKPCVIKPVMTDEEISACRRRDPAPATSGASAAPLATVAVTSLPVVTPALVSCQIKAVMTNEEIDNCRRR